MTTTLGQALRTAAASERAASKFYQSLADRSKDEEARAFFAQLVAEEIAHAESIEVRGRELGEAFEAALPEAAASALEAVPAWDEATTLSADEAFDLAIEAEDRAALYYDAMTDFTSGAVQAFFRDLAAREEAHGQLLREHRDRFR